MSRFDRRLRGLTKAVDREFAELVRFFPIVAGNDFQEAGPDLDRAGFEIRCPVKTRANVSDHAGGEGSTIWNLHLQMGEAAIRIDSTRNPIAATLAPEPLRGLPWRTGRAVVKNDKIWNLSPVL